MSPRAQRAEQRHARNAAIMVQTHWRGKQARDAHVGRLADKREQEAAAVKIQAVYRSSAARRPIPDDDEVEVAVVSAPVRTQEIYQSPACIYAWLISQRLFSCHRHCEQAPARRIRTFAVSKT